VSAARSAVAAMALLIATSACQRPDVTVLRGTDLPPDVYGPPEPTPTAGADVPTSGDVWLVRNGRLREVRDRVFQGVVTSEAEALLLALFQGPSGLRGYETEIPPDTRLNALEVEDGVAQVDLSENFEQGPSRSLRMRVAQVVYTLTEDPQVDQVEFSFEGVPQPVIGVGGGVLARPVLRSDYTALTQPPPKG
jgi:Sporulation and spore germination